MNILTLALEYLGFINGVDFSVLATQNGDILRWTSTKAQPSQAEIDAVKKPAVAAAKREEIYREQEIRSETVWGKEVDRFFFAWVEELYGKILKVSARNNITETDTPITFGLKALRDNRVTLLAGLQTWVDDPLKSAEDIAAFDVVNWAGWSVARP